MKCPTSLCEAMVVLSLYKKTQIGYSQYVDNDVYVDDVPTFCTAKAMDGSFAECSVEAKPVDCMPNVTRVSVEHNAFYWMSQCGTFHMGSAISFVF